MPSATKPKDTVWWFGGAGKYRDTGRGNPTLLSIHSFGWDAAKECFVEKNWEGFLGTRYQRLPVPALLAERCLVRCLDQTFCQDMFTCMIPRDTAEETFVEGDTTLRLHRSGDASTNHKWSSLSMSVEKAGVVLPQQIRLFYDLRINVGNNFVRLSEEEIRTKVYARANA